MASTPSQSHGSHGSHGRSTRSRGRRLAAGLLAACYALAAGRVLPAAAVLLARQAPEENVSCAGRGCGCGDAADAGCCCLPRGHEANRPGLDRSEASGGERVDAPLGFFQASQCAGRLPLCAIAAAADAGLHLASEPPAPPGSHDHGRQATFTSGIPRSEPRAPPEKVPIRSHPRS